MGRITSWELARDDRNLDTILARCSRGVSEEEGGGKEGGEEDKEVGEKGGEEEDGERSK